MPAVRTLLSNLHADWASFTSFEQGETNAGCTNPSVQLHTDWANIVSLEQKQVYSHLHQPAVLQLQSFAIAHSELSAIWHWLWLILGQAQIDQVLNAQNTLSYIVYQSGWSVRRTRVDCHP